MRPLRSADQGSMRPPSWLAGGTGYGRPTAYGRRMSRAADERTGEAAQERDAVERHFTRSVLAMLTVAPQLSYGNGEQARQATFPASGDGQGAPPEESPPARADPAAAVRPGSALTGERCLELFDAQLASRHL